MFLHVSVILFIGGRGESLYDVTSCLASWPHVPSRGSLSLVPCSFWGVVSVRRGVSVHRGLCQERISVRWGLCQEGISVRREVSVRRVVSVRREVSVRRVVSVRREVSVRTGVSVRRNLPYGTALPSCFFIILDITEKMSKDFDLLS